jgi:4-hydroxybenzoyl-CoA reductase beta subunit
MRLPRFDYAAPASLDEALELLESHGPGAAVLAGGTDLVVRLRQRLSTADFVISLKNLDRLRKVETEGVVLKIGGLASLKSVYDRPEAPSQIEGLAEALKSVGAPAIQHEIGTIGGNLLLQTRCIQYNQSGWWRSGRDRCFKNAGQACLVLPEAKECSATCQSDGAVMLAALSAQVVLKSRSAERTIPIGELFSGKGDAPFTIRPEELLTEVWVFPPTPGTGTAYEKLRWRSSVDYPLVSAGAVVSMTKGKVDRVRLALGAAAPKPLIIEEADAILKGQAPTADLIGQAASAARKAAEGGMIENTIAPAEYRRKMVEVMAARALKKAIERAEG